MSDKRPDSWKGRVMLSLDWVNWTCGYSSCTVFLWSWLMGHQIPGGAPGPRAAEMLSKVAGGDLDELQHSGEQRNRADPIHDLKEYVPVPGFLCRMGSETVHHVLVRRSVCVSVRGCDFQHAEHEEETDLNDGSLLQLEHAHLVLDSTSSNIFQNHRIFSAVFLLTPAHKLTPFIVVDQLSPGHQDADEEDEGEPEYAHEDQGDLQQSCEEELSHLGSGSGWKVSKSEQK